jgi:hypothetical protein
MRLFFCFPNQQAKGRDIPGPFPSTILRYLQVFLGYKGAKPHKSKPLDNKYFFESQKSYRLASKVEFDTTFISTLG